MQVMQSNVVYICTYTCARVCVNINLRGHIYIYLCHGSYYAWIVMLYSWLQLPKQFFPTSLRLHKSTWASSQLKLGSCGISPEGSSKSLAYGRTCKPRCLLSLIIQDIQVLLTNLNLNISESRCSSGCLWAIQKPKDTIWSWQCLIFLRGQKKNQIPIDPHRSPNKSYGSNSGNPLGLPWFKHLRHRPNPRNPLLGLTDVEIKTGDWPMGRTPTNLKRMMGYAIDGLWDNLRCSNSCLTWHSMAWRCTKNAKIL